MPGLPNVFFILAAIAVATALGTILSRNAVYSAMFLVLNFASIAVMYLILGAPFIALSQITVYAGSIMVLFLFVIMLLGAERLPMSENLRWQPYIAVPLALLLAADFAYILIRWTSQTVDVADTPAGYGAPEAVGKLLFTQYALPFEITAVILLSAVIGAVVLARPDRPSSREMLRKEHAAPVPTVQGPPAQEQQVLEQHALEQTAEKK
jgi:NADH-quinone oxidoreductase subunit J